MARGRAIHFVPATALGCIELLRRSGIDFKGKTAVVVGDSNVVGAQGFNDLLILASDIDLVFLNGVLN